MRSIVSDVNLILARCYLKIVQSLKVISWKDLNTPCISIYTCMDLIFVFLFLFTKLILALPIILSHSEKNNFGIHCIYLIFRYIMLYIFFCFKLIRFENFPQIRTSLRNTFAEFFTSRFAYHFNGKQSLSRTKVNKSFHNMYRVGR